MTRSPRHSFDLQIGTPFEIIRTMRSNSKTRFQLLLVLPSVMTLSGCATMFGTTYSADNAEYPYEETAAAEQNPVEAVADTSLPAGSTGTDGIQFPDTASQKLLKPLGPPDFDLDSSTAAAEAMFAAPTSSEMPSQPPEPAEENPFAVMARKEEVQQVAATANTVIPNAFVPTANSALSNSATTFRSAEPRMPTPQDHCPVSEMIVGGSHMANAYPDEYIFDGGDRDHPVHYYGGELAGVDTEDTFVEFTDNEGENHVTATNRVAVYAPRFGSIRTIAGPNTGFKIDQAAGATDISGIDSFDELRGIDATVRNTPASGVATREGASGVEIAQPAFMSEKTDSVVMNNQFAQGFEAKVSTGLGTLEISSMQKVNLQILEVASSKIQTGFLQTESTTQATQAYATFRVQATVGTEENGRKGEIHITKEASPRIARPGDVITFTIQFRNIGDYNVQDVRIIDNLTPRLVYVAGTGQISTQDNAGGALAVVPNKQGSQMLEFRLDQPLKGGGSGSITFQAQVR